jgi:hypothetical protein
LAALVALGCSQHGASDAAVFDACYQRCMSPPATACPADHAWCITTCRGGPDPVFRAMPHFGGVAVPDPPGRAQLAQSVAIETVGGMAAPVLRRCIDLPFEVTEMFSTGQPNQPTIEVHLVAGEAARVTDNQNLGSWTFQGVRPAPAAVPRIQVRFRAEKSGLLAIGARDMDTGQELAVAQTSARSP